MTQNRQLNPGLPAVIEKLHNNISKRLTEAVNLRQLKQDFGIYSWTFNKDSTAIEALKNYKLNGIMGNMNL